MGAIGTESVPHPARTVTPERRAAPAAARPRLAPFSVLVLVALIGVAARLLWLSRHWPLVHDAPIMHYLAWRILEGAAPYRDLFDMNFPGVYLLHLAVLGTLGPGDLAWRLVDLGWLTLGAVAIAAFAAPWGVVASAGGGLFFVVYHLANGAWQAGQRDFLLCPFLLGGALAVARWAERALEAPRERTRDGALGGLGLGGLGLGGALAIKPQSILLLLALAAVVAMVARRARRPLPPPLAVFLLSSAVVPVAVVTWIAALGGLGAWRVIVMDYLIPLYSQLGRPSSWAFHRWHVWLAIAAAVGLSLADAVLRRQFTVRHLVAVVGLLYGLVHFFGQGKGWEYHLYPLAAFTCVVLGWALASVRLRRPLSVAVGASLLAIVVLLDLKGLEGADAGWIRDKQRRVDTIVQTLTGRLGPGETVQVLDTTEGGIHALLRLHAAEPTRFVYDFHFFHDPTHPTIRALRAEAVQALAAHPPRFVIVFARGWPAGGYERVEQFPELARLLATYTIDVRGEDYMILASPARAQAAATGAPAGAR